MATTTNLQLQKINSSDFVSPDPINNNMEKIDAMGVDYIIEQGKSGEWWYRKWKSGRAECGIDNKNFGSATLEPWGNVYSTYDGFNFGAYPFAFKNAPFVMASRSPMDISEYYGVTMGEVSSPTTLSPRVDLWRATKLDISNVILSIYAIGFYK